jgi:hypothetical protein
MLQLFCALEWRIWKQNDEARGPVPDERGPLARIEDRGHIAR